MYAHGDTLETASGRDIGDKSPNRSKLKLDAGDDAVLVTTTTRSSREVSDGKSIVESDTGLSGLRLAISRDLTAGHVHLSLL